MLPLFLSACASAAAATYYVDPVNGSDSASGTSTTSAWRRCPGDPTATSTAGAKLLLPGDVVRFKGGAVYPGTITLKRSGTASAPITYDGNDARTWGSGRAIIDRANIVGARCFTANANVSNLVIKGFELRNCGGYKDNDPILSTTSPLVTSTPNGVAVDLTAGGNKNFRLENLYVHRIGQWRNQLPFSGGNSITGTGIALQNCDGVIIRRCEFTKMRNPIAIKSTSLTQNVEVDQCDLHDYFVWGVDIAPRKSGAGFNNIFIHDTLFRDYHQYDAGNWKGAGEKPHTDGIFLRTSAMTSGWTNVNIFNCSFYTDNPEKSQGGTASIYVSQGPSVNIFNNIFNRDRHTRAVGIIGTTYSLNPQTVRIYNNSFLNGPTHVYISGEASTLKRKIYVENNIFYRDSGAVSYVMVYYHSGTPPVTLNNNIYYDPKYTEAQRYVMYHGYYRKMHQVRNQGYETKGYYGDPGYLDVIPVIPSEDDLRLASGALASNKGVNLATHFRFDMAGLPRPSTGAWSVGAYTPAATSLSTLAPNPPTGLRLVALD